MLIECECGADRAAPHHLEACAVDERRSVGTPGEECGFGDAMDWLVDPDEFNRSQNFAHEIAYGGLAKPAVDERATLDDHVVVRYEIGELEADERLRRSPVHRIVAAEQGVERRRIDEDTYGVDGAYASLRYSSCPTATFAVSPR